MLLEAQNLTRTYGRSASAVPALSNVSININSGEFVAIMGPSGSGKSTLMNLIGLLDRPSSGKLLFFGRDTTALSHDQLAQLRNRQIGFVFQSYNLLPRNTALENVEVPLVYARVGRTERIRRATTLLAAVGLEHRAHHWPSTLSGGEQQRVAIARALICDPALILADEPTGALDSRTGSEIMRLLQDLNRAGRTIVLVTHDDHVALYASRLIQLRDGVVVSHEGAPGPLNAISEQGAATTGVAPR